MIEKFSDYESVGFLASEGEFDFEVKSCELADSKSGNQMAVFEVESDAGKTRIYHSLDKKARWSYNNLIAACLKLEGDARRNFQCDYELIGQDLIGKHFRGTVECQEYVKEIKVPLDDGTFDTRDEVKQSYKIVEYSIIK